MSAVIDEFGWLSNGLDLARAEPVDFFAKEILQIKLDPWQEELLEAVADLYRIKMGVPTRYNHDGKNKITVRAMHGPGKTFGEALVAHWFGFCFRGKIPCTAPKERQLLTRLWPEFRKIRSRAIPAYQSILDVTSTRVTWWGDPDWFMIAETASSAENLAGYHDDFLLFICEEASGINELMFPAIEGAISTGQIVVKLMVGNPTSNTGTFYQSHNIKKVSKHYYKMHVSLDKTTRVSRAWVQQQIDKYGKDSPVVKVRCLGEFADSDEYQLILLDRIERAVVDQDPFQAAEHPKIRVTADISDGGEDFTVITVTRRYQNADVVIHQSQHTWPKAEAIILAAKECELLFKLFGGKTTNGDDFVIDALGVGAGTAGSLIENGYNVIVYRGGESSDDTKKWRNRRTQSYIVTRDMLESRRLFILEGAVDDFEEFCFQVCSVRKRDSTSSERVEDLMTRQEMKAEGIKSPDRGDSLVMLYATQQPVIGGGSFTTAQAFGSVHNDPGI